MSLEIIARRFFLLLNTKCIVPDIPRCNKQKLLFDKDRIRRISKQTADNKARKSRFRNALKKMNLLIDGKKKDEALKFLPKLNSELMKIAKTGVIKKQNASRNVSRITKKIAAI